MNVLGSTADVCAALRTLSGTDPLAARMLTGPRVTTLARLTALRPLFRTLPDLLVPGAYGYEASRTRHVDGVVAAELARGTDQLVLLGAGLDTRAHRFPVHSFEVDLPRLSRRKRALASGLPGRVSYIEADLERDDVNLRLLAAGFDPQARSLTLAIGLFMYISPTAVSRALTLAASCPAGSRLLFDYVFQQPDDRFLRAIERRAEPLRFTIAGRDLPALLTHHGLRLVRHLTPDHLHFAQHKPYSFLALAEAVVDKRIEHYRGIHALRPRADGDPC
jgi:methyltransferase (TIGR00027 family)